MKRRWRRIERRGRPPKAGAQRRQTTAKGRAGGPDRGTGELRRRKARVLRGRHDLEIDGGAVLFAHDHLDRQQYDTLGLVTDWLRRTARAWGGKDGNVAGLWAAILGASIATPTPAFIVPPGADAARWRLARALGRLDGSRDLVVSLAAGQVPPVVMHVVEGSETAEDRDVLARLRDGLDRVAGRGRRAYR